MGSINYLGYTNEEDVGTKILLSDGAGAVLIGKTSKNKIYKTYIESDATNSEILTCKTDSKIEMNGIEIYKYAVTETVKNVKELLKRSNISLEDIKYIIPHQSNMKIIKSIATKLKIDNSKIYTNISYVGNTFCASIPIALNELKNKELLNSGDKIILLGYGGGLNTGSILLEI